MKHLIMLMACYLSVHFAIGQGPLQISTDKTISLIFPFPVRYVDRGTRDVLVQQVKESDNILLVKAAIEKFSETNLSVVTGDGSIYSFKVVYNPQPDIWVYHLPTIRKTAVANYANLILDNHRTVRGIEDRKWEMTASLHGIYIKDGVLYYQILLCNKSAIDYDIDLLKFFIRDKTKAKRTAMQENELSPLHISGNTKVVKACDFSVVVIALDKFTIPDAKSFVIQIMEKNGGRHLQLNVKNDKIVKAIPLPDIK